MSTNEFSTLSDYLRWEINHEKDSLKKCSKEMESYKRSFNLTSENLEFLLNKSGETMLSDSHLVAIWILYRLIGSLQAIRVLTLRGYEYDVNILWRNFHESLGLCVYLKDNPEKVESWINGKKLDVSKRKLFLEVKRIFRTNDSRFDTQTEFFYEDLCDYVHSGFFAHLKSVFPTLFEGEDEIIDSQPAINVQMKYPSKPDERLICDLSMLALTLVYAELYLFEDILPNNWKLVLANFLLEEFPKIKSKF